MKKEYEYKIAQKRKSNRLPKYPFKKGETIGNFIVNADDYVYHHKIYQVELTCQCGKIVYRRLVNILNSKNIWCAKCRGYNKYPKRRDTSPHYTNKIHSSWISVTKQNLKRGKNRILKLEIDSKDLKNLYDSQNGKCKYTKIPLNTLNIPKHESNASIDRIDSKKGYTADNIQWVYKPLNIMKNRFSEEEFLFVCEQVYKNFIR